jgi:hypothetical protein
MRLAHVACVAENAFKVIISGKPEFIIRGEDVISTPELERVNSFRDLPKPPATLVSLLRDPATNKYRFEPPIS